MKYKSIDIHWLGHSGFKIYFENKIIYIDPYKISSESEKADFIFCTHSHYDHFSVEDINKITKNGTIIVCTPDSQSKARHIDHNVHLQLMNPDERREFDNIKVWTTRAYNINKPHHSREEDWVGFIIQFNDTLVYHAGDTDLIPEISKLKNTNIDIALLPVGGIATMNAGEAAKAALIIQAKLVIPMHFGVIDGLGSRNDAEIFLKYCQQQGIEAKIID